MMYVIGETGPTAPEIAGIYLGNGGLNSLQKNDYAFFWNSKGRPTRSSLLFGTQQGPATGDPTESTDLFNVGLTIGSFSGAFTPSNNTNFGVSNGIPNGTQYRVNWEVVSIPASSRFITKENLKRKRQKIVGQDPAYFTDMQGVGAGWARRQGISNFGRGPQTVSVGQQISFSIGGPDIGP